MVIRSYRIAWPVEFTARRAACISTLYASRPTEPPNQGARPMNPLDNLPQVRKVLYIIQWVLNGAATVLGAYFVAIDKRIDGLPEWYVVALAVLPVLWTYLGITASKNTPAP